MADKEYTLRAGDAAKELRVTTQAVRDMARRGDLSHEVRFFGSRSRWFFNREEVEELARQRGKTA